MTPAATRRPTRIRAHHRSGRADRPMTPAATRRPPAVAVERRHARELGGAGARR